MNKKLLAAALFSSLVLTGCSGKAADNEKTASMLDTTADTAENDSADVSNNSSDSDSMEEEVQEEETISYQYKVDPVTQRIVPLEDDLNKKVALLTYDDAPDKHAVEIAETLVKLDASAIFFVNGMYLTTDQGKKDLKAIHDMGFEIGNHTQTHASLPSLSEEKQYEEIIQTSDLIEEITGKRPRFFRAPFGQNTDYTKQLAKDEGMTLMNWTYGYDWEKEYQEADALAAIMLDNPYLNDGANLLMHDRSWTLEASPKIITGLKEKGYELLDSRLIESPEGKEEQDND